MTQPWAGKGWGMMAIPRVGHEVVVDFLEGDPDQPIVMGRTYHANMPLPAGFPHAKPQMDLMSQTHKGGGHNGIMMDDSTNGQRLNLHAQRDMNTKVLNNRSTTVKGNHTETVMGNQIITVEKSRYKEIIDDETTSVKKNSAVNVGEEYKLLVQGNVIFETLKNNIVLETQSAKITLFNGGDIDIQGATIQINGEGVHLNPSFDKKNSESGEMSDAKAKQNKSNGVHSVTGEASLISKQSSGVMDANAKLLTAKGDASIDIDKGSMQIGGGASLLDINASTADKKSGFENKVGYVAGKADFSTSGLGGKVEAGVVALNGKVGNDYGSVEGGMKVFSADAEGVGKVFTGQEGRYGFEAKVAAQASAISGEIKGCIGTEESWAMICGKAGANGGPAGDLGGKVIWDNDKENLKFGANGKFIGGAEVEGQLNWKKIKEIF